MTVSAIDSSFPSNWHAEILPSRPPILPSRHFVYPAVVEEVERGALEALVRVESAPPFLATCALGFRDPSTPTGVWSCPHPDWLCAVAGGYAYLIDTTRPAHFTHLRYRPVLQVIPCPGANPGETSPNPAQPARLLLFVGHQSILAWGRNGEAWESDRLSWEGVTITRIQGNELEGLGWDMRTDKDLPFRLDLTTGRRIS
jgi:hypothetical protein